MNFLPPHDWPVEGHFVHYPRCDSTNQLAQQLIQDGQATPGTIVHTDYQTAGRGQQHNQWESAEAQNLTFSIVLFPELPIEQQHYLTMAVSLSVHDVLNELLSSPVAIKWPNDILCESSKICGILIQNNLKGRKIHSCVVGIGLNVNQDEFESAHATSLALLTGHYWERAPLLTQLAQRIASRFQQLERGHTTDLKRHYLENMFWKDEQHLFEDSHGTFYGTILGIDPSGRLAVAVEDQVRYYGTKELVYKF